MGNGVKVKWDGYKMMKIITPSGYMGPLCGLCGNRDGDFSNDMLLGPHVQSPGTRRKREMGACPAQLVKGTVNQKVCSNI